MTYEVKPPAHSLGIEWNPVSELEFQQHCYAFYAKIAAERKARRLAIVRRIVRNIILIETNGVYLAGNLVEFLIALFKP
jgi:hypothetical protein